ncbi:MAG TPA: hypothetical protein VG095_10060 [Chthoniobacterales bacterium]|nr:hypothetical protein [Chthoniobacterales bacterium]
MRTVAALLALALGWIAWRHYTTPIVHAPGVLIAAEPAQIEMRPGESAITHGDFRLQPLARFSLDARLLHARRYRWDRGADLAPIDLAVGWGPMSDQAVLDRLKISQSMRFYWYEYQLPPPIPREEIVRHSTNLHVIPRNHEVAKACAGLRVGELVRLEGVLVEATGPKVTTWRSSLRRDDEGNGACELFLVEAVTKLDPENIRASARLVSR